MVHTIELVFGADTESAIRQCWADLAAAGIPSQAPASRPHVTLLVAERIGPDVDALLAPLMQQMPLPCTIGAPVLFGRVGKDGNNSKNGENGENGENNVVLARLVVPTLELLTTHAEVHRHCSAHLMTGPAPNSVPGRWTAHVTLARRVPGAQLARALRIAGRPAQLTGSFTGLRRWDGDKRVEHPIRC